MGRHFANWLQGYIDYTKASESPTPFHFWTGVATIAGALRRRVWIDERHFQWTPNFYIVLVGPPGVAAKSTSIRSGMKFLERLKIPFGPQSMTWQALTKALEEAISGINYVDRDGLEQRVVMSCLTIPVSELGTFLRMDDKRGWLDSLTAAPKAASRSSALPCNPVGTSMLTAMWWSPGKRSVSMSPTPATQFARKSIATLKKDSFWICIKSPR